MEFYTDIVGFEGAYQISNLGNLKSFKKEKSGRVLKQTNKKGGYFSVVLKSGEKIKCTRIHRIVAEHFIENPENKKQVNHKDLNKQNNCVSNLEWVSPLENIKHLKENNPSFFKSMNNYNQKIRPKTILQFDKEGSLLGEFENAKLASDKTKVCQRNILLVAGKTEYKKGLIRSQAGGFIWKFKE